MSCWLHLQLVSMHTNPQVPLTHTPHHPPTSQEVHHVLLVAHLVRLPERAPHQVGAPHRRHPAQQRLAGQAPVLWRGSRPAWVLEARGYGACIRHERLGRQAELPVRLSRLMEVEAG